MTNAKEKAAASKLAVNYNIPLEEFLKGDSDEEGLRMKVGIRDVSLAGYYEALMDKIPDMGSGVVDRTIEEYRPRSDEKRNLLMVLKSLDANKGLADMRTAVEYMRQNGKAVYSSPYPQIKTFFEVDSVIYKIKYGMYADTMNMRMDGPLLGIYQVGAPVSESFDEDDVLLIVDRQDEPQISLADDPNEEQLPGGEVIIRSTISTWYGESNFDFVRIMDSFCRSHRLSQGFSMAGPANPNEVFRTIQQKGRITHDVAEFWFPGDEITPIDNLDIMCGTILPKVTGDQWRLAIPHELISYLSAYPEKIGAQNFCTLYKGLYGGEALMLVGSWEKNQTIPRAALIEAEEPKKAAVRVFLPNFHFLAVEK